MKSFPPVTQRRESRVFNHADRAIEAENGRYGKWGNGRAGPHERRFALNVQHDDFAANCEVHTGTNGLFPPVSIETIIGQPPDDAIRGHQPRPDSWFDRLAVCAWVRPIQVEAEGGLGPYLLGGAEDDTDLVRPEVRLPVVIEVEGEGSSGSGGPLPRLFAPAR
jgi:hypothetical protein